MTNGSVLRIERAKGKRHNGTFTCVAKTDDDKARSDASLFVYPEDPNGELPRGYPRILKNPVLTSVERDYPFTLTCRAIAGGMSGPLNIYWLKDHTPVNTSDPRVQILQEINGSTVAGSLTIARSQDYDQGKYECVAENEVGVAYSYPVMAYVKVRKVPPHFSKLPEDALVEQGASVNLTCAAVGFPVPRVTWRQEGTRVLDHGDTYFGENGESVLMLTDMQEDSNYTCTATSALGERYNIEANVQVKIKDRRFG